MRNVRRTTLIGMLVLTTFLVPRAAQATPPTGASITIASRVTIGHTEFVLGQITIRPGGQTGWRWSPGTVFALVKSGTLTDVNARCTAMTYPAGATLRQARGAGHVHLGRNLGSRPVVVEIFYIAPAGSSLTVDAPNPNCCP